MERKKMRTTQAGPRPRHSQALTALRGSSGELFSKFVFLGKERYAFIRKEEGKTIPDILIVTGTKMTRTPSNETILFSFN